MNITNFRPINNIHFGNRHFDEYLDDIEAPYENEIIPEYEEYSLKEHEGATDTFRTDELFDRRRGDRVDYYYRVYGSEDDVELNDDIKYRKLPKEHRYANKSVETGYSLPANYYLNNLAKDIYTAENSYKNEKESFQKRVEQGFKKEDVATVYHSAMINRGNDLKTVNFKLAKRGFNMLKSGRSLEDVTLIMDGSKIKYADESERFDEDLFNFLYSYPHSRNTVVERKSNGERLRRDIMEIYPAVSEIFSNKADVEFIIGACQTGSAKNKVVNDELLGLCVESVKNGTSVNKAIRVARQSKIKDENGTVEFSKILFDFLSEHPDKRDFAVNSTKEKEILRTDVIKVYPDLEKMCKTDKEISDLINCLQVGRGEKKQIDSEMLALCKNMTKNGIELYEAIADLNDAKMKYSTGKYYFDRDLFDYLTEYPESRSIVVCKENDSISFRKDRAEIYPEIKKACKDEDDILPVIKSCELRNGENKQVVNKRLVGLALDLIKIEPEWTKKHDQIMNRAKYKRATGAQHINEQKFDLIKTMAQGGNYSINGIYSVTVLNSKNPELCK